MSHDDLDLGLSQAAATFHIPPGDVDVVVHRARRRARRRRTATATLTSLAVVTAAVTGFGLLDDPDGGIPVAASGGVRRGESGIRWERVSSSSALGFARSIDGNGPVYALSTAPGDVEPNPRDHSRVLWKSDDGIEWRSVSKLGDDLFLSDLSSAGSRIYAVGTGPATASVPGQRPTADLVVGWSDDGGKTWRKAALPFDLQAIAGRSTSSGVSFTEVAGGPKGVVAVAVPYAVLDVTKMLPPGDSAPNGWAITDAGVDLLGPRASSPCPPGTSAAPTGEEMRPPPPAEAPPAPDAVPPPPEATATSAPPARATKPPVRMARAQPTTGEVHPTFCYRGGPEDDPVEVSPQQAHGVTRQYTWEQLGVGEDLLRAVRNTPIAFAARPGSTKFERVDLPDVDGLHAPVTIQADNKGFDLFAARWGGRDLRLRNGPPPMALLHSDDGRQWSSVDLAVPGVGSVVAAGRLGDRTALIGAGQTGEPALLRSVAAGGWTSTPFGNVVSRPPGTQLGVVGAAVGPFGAVAVVAVAPPKLDGPSDIGPGAAEQSPDFRLLVTRDGEVWDDHPIDEIAGSQVNGISSIVVTRQQAVITAILAQGNPRPGRKAERATLVGTLK